VPTFARDQISLVLKKRVEALIKGYRHNIGLIGDPGLGKTRLLDNAFREFSAFEEVICIYVLAESFDAQQLVDRWAGAVLSGALRGVNQAPESHELTALLAAATPRVPKTSEAVQRLLRSVRKDRHDVWIRDLFSLTGILAQETGKKVVFMLDEFQELQKLPISDPFRELGKEIMIEKDTLYLVTSSQPGRASDIFREKLSLLFGNFEVIELRPLNFQEISDYLAFHFPKTHFSVQQQKFFISLTNGEPLYLDLLMDRLKFYVASDQDLWVADRLIFMAFQEELLDHKGRISLLFEKMLDPISRSNKENAPYLKTLLAISEGRHRLASIAGFIGRKMIDTKKILSRLMQEDRVRRRGSFYVIEDPLFRFWLREVFTRRNRLYQPVEPKAAEDLMEGLRDVHEHLGLVSNVPAAVCAERLFKEFRNDVAEIDSRKWKCPQFSEVTLKPASQGRFPSLWMRFQRNRWVCQVADDVVREEDVMAFLDEIKRSRTRVKERLLITLRGIDQNARLMAQNGKIQILGLRDLNVLLELYDLPKIMILEEETRDGSLVGTLAQSVHTS